MFKKYIPFLILVFAANVNAEKLESIFVAPDVFITSKIKPSTEYEMPDLVGQTIDFNGRGVGDVLEYDKRKVSRGHTVKWEVGPATKLVSAAGCSCSAYRRAALLSSLTNLGRVCRNLRKSRCIWF